MTTRDPIPSCSLRPDEVEPQTRRWREAAEGAARIERTENELELAFRDDPPESLGELMAVETDCCPFFAIRYDEERRVLRLAVDDAEHRPALDAIAERLGLSR